MPEQMTRTRPGTIAVLVITVLAAISGACTSPVSSPSAAVSGSPSDATFYVAPNGSPSGRGTADDPWDIATAGRKASPGSTVYVHAGTYDAFNVSVSGTTGAPTRFVAYPGERPIIDGSATAALYTITLDNVGNVELSAIRDPGRSRRRAERRRRPGRFEHALSSSTKHRPRQQRLRRARAQQPRTSSSRTTTSPATATGSASKADGEGTVVTNNKVHDNDQMMVNTADISGDDVGGEAIALVHSTGHVLVSDNQIWGNRAVSYDYGYDGGAFSIYAASNWTITGNTTWNNRNILETGTDATKTPCANNTFTRNLNYGATTVDMTVGMVLRCAQNMLVANNTFPGIQGCVFAISHDAGQFGGSVDGLPILNNVISVLDAQDLRHRHRCRRPS